MVVLTPLKKMHLLKKVGRVGAGFCASEGQSAESWAEKLL